MRILVTSNHGNTFNPKEGADARKFNLAVELAKYNEVKVLESDRYSNDICKVPPDIKISYFHEYRLIGLPLSFLLDLNVNFISKIISFMQKEKIQLVQVSFCYGIIATKIVSFFKNKKIKIIYDAHNVENDLAKQVPEEAYPSFVKYFFMWYVPIFERVVVRLADHIISVSQNDKRRFIELYNISPEKITVISSGTKIRKFPTVEMRAKSKQILGIDENKKVILFHGTYNYPPNKEAMDIIINYIAPKFKNKFKNALFLLAGNGVPTFEKDNVKSTGFVNDLDSLLYSADIAIVPLLRGGGTRLKILDYMSVGLPIVSTKKGIEGIDVVEGKDAIVCNDVNEEFIERISGLLAENEQRTNIGANAHRLAMIQYDWEEIGKRLHSLYTDLVSVQISD